MPQLSLRNSLIVYGRIRRLVRLAGISFRAGRLLVVPDSKYHLLSVFSDLLGPGGILSTFAYTPAATTRRPGPLLWSKSASHRAVFTTIHAWPRNSGNPLKISMAWLTNVFSVTAGNDG
jgi:hypothetical protein